MFSMLRRRHADLQGDPPGKRSAGRSRSIFRGRMGERILAEEFLAELGSGVFIEGVGRKFPQSFDGGSEAGEEGLAWFAAREVFFEFLAQRIVHLFIEVVGEFREKSFAGGGPFF